MKLSSYIHFLDYFFKEKLVISSWTLLCSNLDNTAFSLHKQEKVAAQLQGSSNRLKNL